MHYQPEFDLATGAIVGVEALLRWQHPQRGLLSADVFVPESEQTRTFVAVQHWVIETTCRQLAQWRDAGVADNLVLRLNVPGAAGAARRRDEGAASRRSTKYRLRGSQVCIELTERRMPAELDLLAAELDTWRERGITVAVDDFGTGEGTLSHLQLLPIDILKIDQRFVAPMTTDPPGGRDRGRRRSAWRASLDLGRRGRRRQRHRRVASVAGAGLSARPGQRAGRGDGSGTHPCTARRPASMPRSGRRLEKFSR